jgi:hypothetical protein
MGSTHIWGVLVDDAHTPSSSTPEPPAAGYSLDVDPDALAAHAFVQNALRRITMSRNEEIARPAPPLHVRPSGAGRLARTKRLHHEPFGATLISSRMGLKSAMDLPAGVGILRKVLAPIKGGGWVHQPGLA